jgi:parvulin-like peptidyl-prolyl isomerase
MLRTTLLSLVALGLAAQTPAPKPAAKPAAAPAASPQPAAAAVKPEAPKEDKILARIDGVAIHESEMDLMYANLNPQQKQAMAGQNREKAISSYLEFRLLVAKARRMGIDKSPDFDKKLKLSSYQLMAQELLQKEGEGLQKRAQVSDDDVKAYFEANKDAFKTPGKFNARHILVKTKGGPNGDQGLSEDDAKKKMAEIQAEFAKGGKWDDLAKKYSEDPGSKDKGGLYEGIAFGQFVPEFEAAVKKQDIGKVGEPVKSTFGYHLIQVETRGDAEAPVFDAVKEQAKQKATQTRQEQVWKEFLEGLKKEVNLVPAEAAPAKAAAPAAKPASKPEATKPAAPAKKAEGAAK